MSTRTNDVYFQLFIINRSGGLIYNKALSPMAPNLSANDCLRLGSTFHSLHAIAAQIAPVVSAGIERLEADTFVLQCLQTLTGAKFVLTAAPSMTELDVLLQGIYELYSDYVLKNPFYEVDMPIRCDLFNKHLDRFIQRNIAALQRKKAG